MSGNFSVRSDSEQNKVTTIVGEAKSFTPAQTYRIHVNLGSVEVTYSGAKTRVVKINNSSDFPYSGDPISLKLYGGDEAKGTYDILS